MEENTGEDVITSGNPVSRTERNMAATKSPAQTAATEDRAETPVHIATEEAIVTLGTSHNVNALDGGSNMHQSESAASTPVVAEAAPPTTYAATESLPELPSPHFVSPLSYLRPSSAHRNVATPTQQQIHPIPENPIDRDQKRGLVCLLVHSRPFSASSLSLMLGRKRSGSFSRSEPVMMSSRYLSD